MADFTTEARLLIIHHSEIALKKGNRAFFEKRLRLSIRNALAGLGEFRIISGYGRILLFIAPSISIELALQRLRKVIGIAAVRVSFRGDVDPHVLKCEILEQVKNLSFASFRVDARRADKSFPYTSVQINEIVGGYIHERLNKPVDLKAAELVIPIEIFNRRVYFSIHAVSGERGLPIGSTGKVLSLLSSGIDSPVSSFLMMKRGCHVTFVHFHSFPFTEKSSYYNAIELVRRLTVFQYHSRLYLVPLAEIQRAIIAAAPAKLRIVLYRRVMLRLAERIAGRERCPALVTGDSLGQVASQTLHNIAAVSEAGHLPVLRPLIGLDKEEIIRIARRIGTFEVSTEPYDDCCSFMAPPNPETNAKPAEVLEAERRIMKMGELLQNALAKIEIERFSFPV